MSILPVMVLVSLLVVLGAGIAFFWAVEHDQFEDLQSPAFLPLLDESEAQPPTGATAPAGSTAGNPPRGGTAAGATAAADRASSEIRPKA